MSMAPVRWGFLGAGTIARNVLGPVVHAAGGAVLRAAAARDLERARSLGPAGQAYGDYGALLADPEVDAVYVSLANDAHARWTIAALDAGKHVLVEKPAGLSAGEVDAMAAAADRGRRLLVEASMYRWHPRIRTAQRLLAEGAIGAARRVDAVFGFGGVAEGNYRFDPQRGGGAAHDVGCYVVSAALWAFGGAPRAVTARQQRGPSGVDLATGATLRFDAGEATIHAGMAQADQQRLVVESDTGTLEVPEAPYTAWLGQQTQILLRRGGSTEQVPTGEADAYRLMIEAVSAAIRGEGSWVLPLAETRACAAVLDACRESARSGGAEVEVNRRQSRLPGSA
jgi:predicted dehydrogenase